MKEGWRGKYVDVSLSRPIRNEATDTDGLRWLFFSASTMTNCQSCGEASAFDAGEKVKEISDVGYKGVVPGDLMKRQTIGTWRMTQF